MPNFKNFSISTVATAPSPAASGTSLVVQAGHGARFPTVPFKATIWPAGVQPTQDNAEIVNVTVVAVDTFTIARAQESSTARTVVVGDQIAATMTAAVADLITHDSVIAYHNTTASIPNAAWTVLPLNSEDADTAGYHDTVTNNSRLTVPTGKGGLYVVTAHAAFASNPTGVRFLGVRKNGVDHNTRISSRQNAGSAFETVVTASGLIRLAAGDFIEAIVFQNSGGALDTGNATTESLRNNLEMARVSD